MKYEELMSSGSRSKTGMADAFRAMAPGDVLLIDDSLSKAVKKEQSAYASLAGVENSRQEYRVRTRGGAVYVVRLKLEDMNGDAK